MAKPLDTHRQFYLYPKDLYNYLLYVGALFLGLIAIPNNIVDFKNSKLLISISLLGLWRYGWWMTHFVRAQIYSRKVFPSIRKEAEKLWNEGWRSKNVHFLMTTYKENRDTTERVISSIIKECRSSGIPAKLYVGTSDASDEDIIENYIQHYANDIDLETIFIRQNQPGKRFALGLALRAISRHNIRRDDPVIFMDGDSIIEPGLFRKCLPLFSIYPDVDGLTTDEKAIVFGPKWFQLWLDLRFAQRHLGMQSWSLSKKVMALTGRLSVLRAKNVVTEEFISTIESDHLYHWLWGTFRFLSGDDKSTWYWLLKNGSMMLYVPDALVHTVEYIEGNGFYRAKENMLRWCGNTLRNGFRAIALGPHKVGLFVWWCIIDQRIAMWTTMVGPMVGLALALYAGPMILISYFLWVFTTRLFLTIILSYYAGRINVFFPLIVYCNQLTVATVKVYMLFRLSKQRWSNRGGQKTAEGNTFLAKFQNFMAVYLTCFYTILLFFAVALYSGIIGLPSWLSFITAIGL